MARTLELAKPDLRPARVSDVEAVLGLPKEPLRAVGQRPISLNIQDRDVPTPGDGPRAAPR